MYNISEDLKSALLLNNRKSYITATITTKSNKTYNINDSNIEKGTLYITNQCVNNDNFEYGAVYSAELGFTIKSNIDRYSLYDAEIKISEHKMKINGLYEEIPLGIYYVTECNRKQNKISIKALDKMIMLDEEISDNTNGKIYNVLMWLADKCSIELEQNESDINLLVNGKTQITIDKTKIATYRDLLSSICKITCTFAVFDRSGKLKLQTYSGNSNYEISGKFRKSSSFSDFETYFNSVKASFIAQENYYPYEKESQENLGGLQLDLGEIPIIQGLPTFKYTILQNILDELIKIRYTPFDIDAINNSFLDLGDMISWTGVFGQTIKSYITYYKWQYRGIEKYKGAGGNPKLANAQDKTTKQLNNAMNQVSSSNEIVVYSFMNTEAYTTKQSEVQICKFNFSCTDTANPILIATVSFSLDKDGEVEFHFYEDYVERQDLVLKKYYQRGQHFETLFMNAKDEIGNRSVITINAKCSYFNSDIRQLKAQVNNTDVDTTIPTIAIPIYGVHAVVYSQGISANSSNWDGTINVEDSFNVFDTKTKTNIKNFTESVVANPNITQSNSDFAEMFGDITSKVALSIKGFTDTVVQTGASELGENITTESKENLMTEDNNNLILEAQ